MEGVNCFKYLERTLDQTKDDWSGVRQNIMRPRLVWGRLGMLLIREGAEPKVSAVLYRAVAQAVLLFGDETWVLLTEMEQKV